MKNLQKYKSEMARIAVAVAGLGYAVALAVCGR